MAKCQKVCVCVRVCACVFVYSFVCADVQHPAESKNDEHRESVCV